MAPTAAQFIAQAKTYLGVPYASPPSPPQTLDCSSLVYWSLEQIGINGCPHTSESQWYDWCEHLSGEGALVPGDLVFEQWNVAGEDAAPGHVVIYLGNGQVIEAPQTGEHVHVRPWSASETEIVGYGRIPGLIMSPTRPSVPADDISTMSANGVVSLSFAPGSVSHIQITTDPGGPLQLRVVLSCPTGPLVLYGGGGGSPDFTVGNGYGNIAIPSQYTRQLGGISLESAQAGRVFSATAY